MHDQVAMTYSTAHVQVYKQMHVMSVVPREILKITHVLGSCDMRNTLLASDY